MPWFGRPKEQRKPSALQQPRSGTIVRDALCLRVRACPLFTLCWKHESLSENKGNFDSRQCAVRVTCTQFLRGKRCPLCVPDEGFINLPSGGNGLVWFFLTRGRI